MGFVLQASRSGLAFLQLLPPATIHCSFMLPVTLVMAHRKLNLCFQHFAQPKFAVQGVFHVAAQQPVLYTVQESLDLLSLDNKVCPEAAA